MELVLNRIFQGKLSGHLRSIISETCECRGTTCSSSGFLACYQLPPGCFLEPSRHGTVGSHTCLCLSVRAGRRGGE